MITLPHGNTQSHVQRNANQTNMAWVYSQTNLGAGTFSVTDNEAEVAGINVFQEYRALPQILLVKLDDRLIPATCVKPPAAAAALDKTLLPLCGIAAGLLAKLLSCCGKYPAALCISP